MSEATRPKPGLGWKQHPITRSIWDHVSGVRLHLGGYAGITETTFFVSANQWPESQEADRAIRIAGSRRRGLMIWAMDVCKRIAPLPPHGTGEE